MKGPPHLPGSQAATLFEKYCTTKTLKVSITNPVTMHSKKVVFMITLFASELFTLIAINSDNNIYFNGLELQPVL